MNVLIAPDSFKGCMSSQTVCDIIEKAILEVDPSIHIIKTPLADGGEGTLSAVLSSKKGRIRTLTVHDSKMDLIKTSYALFENEATALIEMATVNGLTLTLNNKDPLNFTTYGVGEMINDALNQGAKKILLALGGSATNDAGAGMMMALGIKFLDENKQPIFAVPNNFSQIHSICFDNIQPKIKECEFILLSDVNNPLCGINGSTYIFGKQKGIKSQQMKIIDKNLHYFANLLEKTTNKKAQELEGAGAAGGLGFGSMIVLNATYHSGIDTLLHLLNIRSLVQSADLVITGEGCSDSQSAFGKTCYGISKLSQSYNKPVLCLSGAVLGKYSAFYNFGITAAFGILNAPASVNKAIHDGPENLYQTAKNVFRLLCSFRQ